MCSDRQKKIKNKGSNSLQCAMTTQTEKKAKKKWG